MGPPAVSLILAVVLGLTATLPAGLTMVHAEGSSVPEEDTTTPNMTRVDNQCSPLQRRQDLLDTRLIEVNKRMTERDTSLNGLDSRLSTQLSELHTQLNGLNARLNTQQSEVNTRLNRLDSRLDGIETAISDMKDFLQERMEAMDKKVEWALTDTEPRHDVSMAQLHLGPQQDDTVKEKPQVYRGCQEALTHGANTSGVYTIAPDHDNSFNVYCEQRLDGGGWTVFQVRYNGSVDFYNDWYTYKAGFGELTGEFWLGNDKIHSLTKHHNMQLKIELTSPAGEVQYADYNRFWIGDEAQQYKLNVSGYTGGGIPGDSLTQHNGSRFSTRDADNDNSSRACARLYKGGWWYDACHHSNLNGLYGGTQSKGMRWHQWKGGLAMKATRMMMRRRP